ncbi:MAG: (d)CMP kinase, partial [Gemmatimonadota bacterium]|nr:(d)CMP kinase [Gemmatimonadota bacterium]
DDADRNREISPLIQAADAILIDTSVMAFEEQVAKIVELGKRWWDAAN